MIPTHTQTLANLAVVAAGSSSSGLLLLHWHISFLCISFPASNRSKLDHFMLLLLQCHWDYSKRKTVFYKLRIAIFFFIRMILLFVITRNWVDSTVLAKQKCIKIKKKIREPVTCKWKWPCVIDKNEEQHLGLRLLGPEQSRSSQIGFHSIPFSMLSISGRSAKQ